MRNNNNIRIRGNLVKNPVIYSDKNFAIARVAVNYQGRKDQETMFFEVKFFGDRIKDLDYFDLGIGDRVVVDGSLTIETRNKDDKVFTDMVIYCDTIEKIWRKPKSESKSEDDQSSLATKF